MLIFGNRPTQLNLTGLIKDSIQVTLKCRMKKISLTGTLKAKRIFLLEFIRSFMTGGQDQGSLKDMRSFEKGIEAGPWVGDGKFSKGAKVSPFVVKEERSLSFEESIVSKWGDPEIAVIFSKFFVI
jgi:hypothetical protein